MFKPGFGALEHYGERIGNMTTDSFLVGPRYIPKDPSELTFGGPRPVPFLDPDGVGFARFGSMDELRKTVEDAGFTLVYKFRRKMQGVIDEAYHVLEAREPETAASGT